MKPPRSHVCCSTISHRLAVVVATILLLLLLSCFCTTTLAQELIESPPPEPDPSCLDNDAIIQQISGNPQVTCERLAKNGRCTSNCQPLSQTCCVSCGPICADIIANADASEETATTLPAKKQPQLSRYCEVLVTLPNNSNNTTTTDVMWHGGCNETLWNSFRYFPETEGGPEALVREQRPNMVSMKLNGPRYMLISESTLCCDKLNDSNSNSNSSAPPLPNTMTIRGMTFSKIASLEEDVGGPPSRYTTTSVERNTNFTWCGGCEVYLLKDTINDHQYIMQSYSQYVDPSLKVTDLANLGSRLELPQGWTYESMILPRDVSYASKIADVITDDFENAYTKLYREGCETCEQQQLSSSLPNNATDMDYEEEEVVSPVVTSNSDPTKDDMDSTASITSSGVEPKHIPNVSLFRWVLLSWLVSPHGMMGWLGLFL